MGHARSTTRWLPVFSVNGCPGGAACYAPCTMPRQTARERELHDCLAEAAVRLWESIPEEERPSLDWVRHKTGFGSTAPAWALLTRRTESRPGVDRILDIGNALVRWNKGDRDPEPDPAQIPKRPGSSATLTDDAGLLAEADKLFTLRAAQPLVFADGKLPTSAGPVSPVSFVLRYGCAELEVRRPTHGDLFPGPIFPYAPQVSQQHLFSRFEVAPDQILDRWIGKRTEELSDEPRSPVIFCIGHLKAVTQEERIRITAQSHYLLALDDWSMRMSPDFALLDRCGRSRAGHEWGTDGTGSMFAHCVRAKGFDAALDMLKGELNGKVFLCSPRASSYPNLLTLLDLLHLKDPHIDNASIIRFAIHHMVAGHLQSNLVAVGGAPHYWAATAPGSGLRVLVTEEDLFGMPPGWPEVDSHSLSATQRRRHELRIEVDSLRQREQSWTARIQAVRKDSDSRPWRWDPMILVFRSDAGSPRELQVAAHYFRETFRATKNHWMLGDKRRTFAQAILDGYDYWGGAGVSIPLEHMIDFIDFGMHLHTGHNYLNSVEPLLPINDLDPLAPFKHGPS